MAKRIYNEADRAAVFVTLQINKGNVARTSRDTGIAAQTVRDWRDKWDSGAWDAPTEQQVDSAVSDSVGQMKNVRDKALVLIEDKLHEGKLRELGVIFGILDDKIRLAQGLATSRSETVHALPSPEEMKDLFQGMISGAIEAQKMRDKDVIEVTAEQAKALPRDNEGD